MRGLHLTADLYRCQCAPHWLTDVVALAPVCRQAVQSVGLQVVGELFHTFPGSTDQAGGLTATLLLAESHVCVHTWPELGAVTLDVYVCNFTQDHSDKAESVLALLTDLFQPLHTGLNRLHRGGESMHE